MFTQTDCMMVKGRWDGCIPKPLRSCINTKTITLHVYKITQGLIFGMCECLQDVTTFPPCVLSKCVSPNAAALGIASKNQNLNSSCASRDVPRLAQIKVCWWLAIFHDPVSPSLCPSNTHALEQMALNVSSSLVASTR